MEKQIRRSGPSDADPSPRQLLFSSSGQCYKTFFFVSDGAAK
jgi:hypothetical protein